MWRSLLQRPSHTPSPRTPLGLLGTADGVWGLALTPLGLPEALVLPAVGHQGQDKEWQPGPRPATHCSGGPTLRPGLPATLLWRLRLRLPPGPRLWKAQPRDGQN